MLRTKKDKERVSRINKDNGLVYTQMIDMTGNDNSARALGLVLCAIHDRQGEILQQLQEIQANSWLR